MDWIKPEWGIKHIIVAVLLIVLILTRIFNKNEFVKNYKDLISLLVFVTLAVILGIEFYQKKYYIGLVVLGLATLAIAKVYYDRYKSDKEEKQ